jgi:hypothetical protein
VAVIPQDVVPIRNLAISSHLLSSRAKDVAISPRLGNRHG